MIAEAKGFFKAEKLDFKLVIGNAGTHGRQALAAGQALFAHGDASHPLQLSDARQEVQDRPGDADDRLDLQHRGPQGPLRCRHHHGREARRLQAARRRQADRRRDRHRLRHLDVRHLRVRVEEARRPDQLGRRRRAEDHVPGPRDEAVRRHHGGARLGDRGGDEGLRQGDLRHVQAGRVRRGVRRHRAGARRSTRSRRPPSRRRRWCRPSSTPCTRR